MLSTDWTLIVLAVFAVATLVVLVTRVKLNAFIALLSAALIVGLGAVVMGLNETKLDKEVSPPSWKTLGPLTALRLITGFQDGLGATLGSTAAIIGLGIMLGKLLAESGGAEVLAKRFAKFFGPERVGLCIMALALVVGLVTWFAVGLLLLLPILLTLTRETKKPFLLLAIPLISVLSVMHGLMPPHPGPVAAIGSLNANMGMVLVWGFIIGIPTAIIGGPIFARRAARLVEAQPPMMPEKAGSLPEGIRLPGFGITLFTILLPVLLMLLSTVAELVFTKGTPAYNILLFTGNATVALSVSVVFAMWSLGTACGYKPAQLMKFTEDCVGGVGMTLLVVGGGGGFAKVLEITGASKALGGAAALAHLPPLLYGWLIAAFIRVATGSATVSITVAAGLLVPVVAQHPEQNVELLIMAIGCGSLFLSHLNDGGFWIVKDCFGLTVSQTLRTWTITETIIGICGLIITLIVDALWRMLH
jgi:gluconate:H+ symporter, GntP family